MNKNVYILINEERMNERKKNLHPWDPITKHISRMYSMNEKKSSSHVTRTTQFYEWCWQQINKWKKWKKKSFVAKILSTACCFKFDCDSSHTHSGFVRSWRFILKSDCLAHSMWSSFFLFIQDYFCFFEYFIVCNVWLLYKWKKKLNRLYAFK